MCGGVGGDGGSDGRDWVGIEVVRQQFVIMSKVFVQSEPIYGCGNEGEAAR